MILTGATLALSVAVSFICFWGLQFSDRWQQNWQYVFVALTGCFVGIAYGVFRIAERYL